jgi:hypothetical protein
MSALPIYPKISVHYPSQAFFAQEATVDAQKLVGTYNYPTHFEISLGRSVPNGNEVYKACPGQDVFHAFLMGRIKQLDFHVAEQEEVIGLCWSWIMLTRIRPDSIPFVASR